MKVFIGGQKTHHNRTFERTYPTLEFIFAQFDAPLARWVSGARKADVVIIDTSRCSHDIVDSIKKRCPNLGLVIVDGKAQIRGVLDGLVQEGAVRHTYTQPAIN